WSKLSEVAKPNEFLTAEELIREWWKELVGLSKRDKVDAKKLLDLREELVRHMQRTNKLMVPKRILSGDFQIEIDYLRSSRLLVEVNNHISFFHQTIYDYFIVEKMYMNLYENNDIEDIIGN